MAASKRKANWVYVTIRDLKGSIVFSDDYPFDTFYDSAHVWETSAWRAKKFSHEGEFIYTEEDASVDRVGLVKYAPDGSVIGDKMSDKNGRTIFAKGVYVGS